LDGHFKKSTREEVVVFVSDNILTPDSIRLVGEEFFKKILDNTVSLDVTSS
jgi:hypothetical protein